MQLYPGWTARDNYAINSKKKKRKKDRSQDGGGTTLYLPLSFCPTLLIFEHISTLLCFNHTTFSFSSVFFPSFVFISCSFSPRKEEAVTCSQRGDWPYKRCALNDHCKREKEDNGPFLFSCLPPPGFLNMSSRYMQLNLSCCKSRILVFAFLPE